jgi:lysyl-tRNA synthetase class 2
VAVTRAEAKGLDLFRFVPGYHTHITAAGKEPLLLLLLAFLVAFALTRLYTRLARRHGWGSGSVHGVHLHHMVVGIVIVLVAGLLAIAGNPGATARDGLAIAFGVGAALTLDEFALSLYLKDVYWTDEGRSSIDATIMGVLLAGLLLVGTSPFGIGEEQHQQSRTIASSVIGLNVILAVVTFLKGRLVLGLLSIFLPPVGLVCTVRLAKPRSPWSGWFYGERKLARSHERFDERDRMLHGLKERLYDLVGGAPSEPKRKTGSGGLPGV